MYNLALENNQPQKANTQKYSLRQKMTQLKIKNEPILLPNFSDQNLLSSLNHNVYK